MTEIEEKLHRIDALANYSAGEPCACPSACLIKDYVLEVMNYLAVAALGDVICLSGCQPQAHTGRSTNDRTRTG